MKNKTVYTCQSCSAQFPKWMGKCPECNQWNSLVEENYSNESAISSDSAKGHALFKKNLKDSVQKNVENRPIRNC